MHAPATRSAFPDRTRIAIFVTVLTALMAAWLALILGAWHRFGPGPEWIGTALACLLAPALLFAPVLLLSRRGRAGNLGASVRIGYWIAALALGLLSFLFLAAAAAWIVGGALSLFGARAEELAREFAAAAFLAGAGAALYGFLNVRFGLRVARRDVVLPGLPPAWRMRTVALVTDLHIGHIHRRAFARRVAERLRHEGPDLVLVGGDLFDGVEGDYDGVLAPWKTLAPPFGVHYVTGNHEEYAGPEGTEAFVATARRAGMRELGGRKLDLDGLQLLGAHYGTASDPEAFAAFLRGAGIERDRPALLLSHVPDAGAFPAAAAAGVSLFLSGHTHAGQVWPWSFLAWRTHGIFTYGLKRFDSGSGSGHGAMQVCTSSGAGSWGPPMRVGTDCEIVLLRLLPAA